MKQTSETIELGIFLALVGGFMDAYSYICRGKVFANAQTGNMLLFGVKLSEGKINDAIRYGMPVLAFSTGIFLAEMIRHIVEKIENNDKKILHWRQIGIVIEMLLLLSVCFISQKHNLLANNITSMACGIQVESFRKIHGHGIATTMCIGNLRSATENMYGFLKNKNNIFLRKSILYYFVIICFVVGAILGNIFINIMNEKSMIVCVFFLFISFFMMFKEERESIIDL
ncbi:YoaK family protein [Peptoanaerobacter stomatis]